MNRKEVRATTSPKLALSDEDITNYWKKRTIFNVQPAIIASNDKIDNIQSLDQLPVGHLQLVNSTRDTNSEGEHWVGFATTPTCVIYFDSLGREPQNKLYSIGNFSHETINNSQRTFVNIGDNYEYEFGSTCGEYVAIYFHLLSNFLVQLGLDPHGRVNPVDIFNAKLLENHLGIHAAKTKRDVELLHENDQKIISAYFRNK
jgi:hypothetical protein